MTNVRSDFEADFRRFSDMLRWTDSVVAIGVEIVVLLLLLVWWLR